MITANVDKWQCEDIGVAQMLFNYGKEVKLEVYTTQEAPLDFKYIFGMDGIVKMGGVSMNSLGRVLFSVVAASDVRLGAACAVSDRGDTLVVEE